MAKFTLNGELSDTDETYKDPRFGMQFTGGSSSIKHSFEQYRELGARARFMLMSAAADLWGLNIDDITTDSGIVIGNGGQRISYGELATAAMQQAIPTSVKLKDTSEFKMIGKGIERLDTVAKSTGQQNFGIDLSLPESRVVLIARPPTFGGNVVSFDASEARAVPGVDDILKVSLDLNASGVAVIANGYWPAKQARDKLTVEWANGSNPLPDSEQIKTDFTQLLDKPGLPVQDADISGLSTAAKTIKADFEFPFLAHTPMEPLNATVEMVGEGDALKVIIYSGTQFQTFDQLNVAEVMGLKPEQVNIRKQFAGGGFGRRATGNSDCLADAARCMNAWLASGRKEPLKLMWSREDDVRGGYYRPFTMHRAEIGLNNDGEIVAWKHRVVQPALSVGTPLEALFMKDGLDGSAVHCNLAVNPTSVEAQIQGSILMGLGTILPGAEITVKDGRVQQSNFHDYIVARMPKMPEVDVHIVQSNEPPTGVGEPGLPPTAPAIANAIYALTGEPIHSLPIKENLDYRVKDPVT